MEMRYSTSTRFFDGGVENTGWGDAFERNASLCLFLFCLPAEFITVISSTGWYLQILRTISNQTRVKLKESSFMTVYQQLKTQHVNNHAAHQITTVSPPSEDQPGHISLTPPYCPARAGGGTLGNSAQARHFRFVGNDRPQQPFYLDLPVQPSNTRR